MTVIKGFKDEYDFLSNSFITPVTYNGTTYNSAEAAYQAQKCPSKAKDFVCMTVPQAIAEGHKVLLIEDWHGMRDKVMEEIVRQKFVQNKYLSSKLLETGEAKLIFQNTWHQNYWGVCTCSQCSTVRKHNQLGLILEKVRGELEWQSRCT